MLSDVLILVCDQSKCINICKRLQKRIQLAKALYKFLDFINRKYFTLILKFKIFNQRCTGKFCYRYGHFQNTEAVTGSVRKSFTKFTGKHLCQGLFFNKVAVIKLQGSALQPYEKRDSLVFSCELCNVFKNTFFASDCFSKYESFYQVAANHI